MPGVYFEVTEERFNAITQYVRQVNKDRILTRSENHTRH